MKFTIVACAAGLVACCSSPPVERAQRADMCLDPFPPGGNGSALPVERVSAGALKQWARKIGRETWAFIKAVDTATGQLARKVVSNFHCFCRDVIT